MPASSAPARQSGLGLLGEGTEAHVRHEDRDVEPQRLVGVRADAHRGVDLDLVEQRETGQLGGDELDPVPRRKLFAGHAHGRHRPVRARLGQAVGRELVDEADERLLHHHVRVAVVPLVDVRVERLGVAHEVVGHLECIDVDTVVLDPAGELLQRLGVVVGAHPGVDAVVPAVQAAQQVVPVDGPVRQQRPPVLAPPNRTEWSSPRRTSTRSMPSTIAPTGVRSGTSLQVAIRAGRRSVTTRRSSIVDSSPHSSWCYILRTVGQVAFAGTPRSRRHARAPAQRGRPRPSRKNATTSSTESIRLADRLAPKVSFQ